jgi:hypothetical protein
METGMRVASSGVDASALVTHHCPLFEWRRGNRVCTWSRVLAFQMLVQAT